MYYTELPSKILTSLHNGVVIPALPLALNKNRKLDERRQRALMRYYLDAGAGGVAVGVHTTQFEIRLPEFSLYKPVLEIAREEFNQFEIKNKKPVFRIAGVIGKTRQAVAEAELAKPVTMLFCLAWLLLLKPQTMKFWNIAGQLQKLFLLSGFTCKLLWADENWM